MAVSDFPAPRAFTCDDLVRTSRLSDPRPSPDGARVAFVVQRADPDADTTHSDLWLLARGSRTGGPPRRLTRGAARDHSPRWSPRGDALYFLSARSGTTQLWHLPVDGGEAAQITDLPLPIEAFAVAPDGRCAVVALRVFPTADDATDGPIAATVARREAQAQQGSGRVYDRLFVRHWDTWKDGRRQHLFVVPLAAEDDAAANDATGPVGAAQAIDLMGAMDADSPTLPFGDDDEWAFTPDGASLVFTARDAGAAEAWSTRFDLWCVPLDGSRPPRPLTDGPAWNTHPRFAPDGRTLAYLAMARPGYESDRRRIVLRDWPVDDAASARILSEAGPDADWDRSIADLAWTPDGRALIATAQDEGRVALVRIDATTGIRRVLSAVGHARGARVTAGGAVIFGRDDFCHPIELYDVPVDPPAGSDAAADDDAPRPLTRWHAARFAALRLGAVETFTVSGADDAPVRAVVVHPAVRPASGRAPFVLIIHGGPQGAFLDDFHERWNPQVYAGAGYAVVMLDVHGSTGYGQAFTDSIAGDWGGKPLVDLQRGLAAVLARHPWIDPDRGAALGASYGGYMINWIAGRWPDRFRCLVNHAGLYDLRSMYGATEELWFPEWEMGGTPWAAPAAYARHNPADHVMHWRTPMLVIHGARDFRVPLEQGLATFTTLQRRGIASRLLVFDDENHWVTGPRNRLQWHREVLAWLDRFVGLAGDDANPG
ncbi:MAG: S9 family peptidase [Acidobacteriota bacterium]